MPRSPSEALTYYTAAISVGPWSGLLRRGLDQYLTNHFGRALFCYLLGGEIGTVIHQIVCSVHMNV